MEFKTLSQIKKAVIKLNEETEEGKRVHYPVLFKKALIQFHYKTSQPLHHIALKIGMNNPTLYNWKRQYDDGLYQMDGTYAVSHKSKKANKTLLEMLYEKRDELGKKIKLIEQAEAMGLKVTES